MCPKRNIKSIERCRNKRRFKAAQGSQQLSKLSKKMVKEGSQKIFKNIDRNNQAHSTRDKPVTLYYALSANKSRNEVQVFSSV